MKRFFSSVFIFCSLGAVIAQNPLSIPPLLTGTEFNLDVQNGTTEFWPGISTPTYGINGALLGPTLVVNKWDWVTMHVTNDLTGSGNSTTMHWHGLHVPASEDGGPHQIIEQGTTWSPSFQILNDAGTFWYHPHGAGKTDLQVSRGIAGMLIVKDSAEAELTLPRNYGVDDFPIVIQSKAFDILNQIAIATQEDTLICVNGTAHPFLDAPAQLIRFRILNGSSMRVYNLGLSDDLPFFIIGNDGGLLNNSVEATRLIIGPGERYEILIDLQGKEGNTINLKSYSSELANGYYGAATVTGMMGGEIPDYNLNPLNGADFQILQINVVSQTPEPATTIPATLVENLPFDPETNTRIFNLQPDAMMDPVMQVNGPFNINGDHFDMEIINETVYLNSTEKWRIENNTGIAHPFHIHDIQFYIDNINGAAVPLQMQGKKDVVLVKPMEYVEVITKFADFADPVVPYMYHCHMLHHEDDGMMGSFVVIDTSANQIMSNELFDFQLTPNPTANSIKIQMDRNFSEYAFRIINSEGKVFKNFLIRDTNPFILDIEDLPAGIYTIIINAGIEMSAQQFVKM